MDAILERRRQVLYGIDIVRKICNHPDLLEITKSSSVREMQILSFPVLFT